MDLLEQSLHNQVTLQSIRDLIAGKIIGLATPGTLAAEVQKWAMDQRCVSCSGNTIRTTITNIV